MAQRAKIGINGDPLGFDEQLDRIQTPGIGGGSVTWLPEADTRCETLNVTANGTYVAADAGKYGYDYVTVSVPGSSVTGKDPATGEEVVVRPDPETGEIEKTVVPVEIRVITPPTNPYGTYVDGQTITKDGMVVKAYGANGDEMLTVPVAEITLNPDRAVFDPEKDRKRSGTATSDLIDGTIDIYNGQGVVTPTGAIETFTAIAGVHGVGSAVDAAVRRGGGVRCIVASANTPFDYTNVLYQYDKGAETYFDSTQTASGLTYTYDGKTVYYNSRAISGGEAYTINFNASENDSDIEKLAWAMIYGDTEISPAGSPQTITVSWPRPGDGAVLETTFDILVGPRSGQGDD